jgi:hypothetical protein
VPGKRQIEPVDTEVALGPLEPLLPCGAARRLVEAIVEKEQVTERGFDSLAPKPDREGHSVRRLIERRGRARRIERVEPAARVDWDAQLFLRPSDSLLDLDPARRGGLRAAPPARVPPL